MASLASPNRDWEGVFSTWSGAPSVTQRDKCENAERAIRKAIDASDKLNTRNIEVFAQGSYTNRTNVTLDSDVDICVLCKDTFFPDYSMTGYILTKVRRVPQDLAYLMKTKGLFPACASRKLVLKWVLILGVAKRPYFVQVQ